MDVFEVGHLGEFDFQLHDHNPGTSESGLFWTMPIPPASVGMDFASGEAVFALSDAQMPDFGNLLTALWDGGDFDAAGMRLRPVFPSTVSMEVRWSGGGIQEQVRDFTNRFVHLRKPITSASVKWRAVRRGAMFESDDGPQNVRLASIGQERNGVFFES
jgi:hypothetical protein